MSSVDGVGVGGLALGGRLTDHVSLGVLAATFSRDLIDEVINVTGKREKRDRLLPAHVMVRYVIALGLLFGESYEEVMRQLICVITTILDPKDVPAKELAFAYHQRWEHESGLDEIKTHLRGGGEVRRSKSPQMIEQEMWGLLLAHYAVRALMCKAADEARLDPDRLAFIRAVRVVRRRIDDPAAVSP